MNITKAALNNNRVTILVLVIIVILGLMIYKELPRDSMPPYTVRVASVVTAFPGASPERVEMLVSDKIEKVAQEIPEVDYIKSESRTGLSVVTVALQDYVPERKLQAIWDRLRRKIEGIQNTLPQGIHGPNVKDEDIGVVYGIIVGMTSDGFEAKELENYAEDLKNDLIALPEASKVELGGVIDERIFVEFNDAELARIGLSAGQLKNIIASTNIVISAGEVNLGDERIIMEASGNLETIEALESTIIPIGKQGETVQLKDITEIRRDYIYPNNSIVKIDGEPAISLFISLKEGANIIKLGQQVDVVLADYKDKFPVGIEAKRISSQDHVVDSDINNFIENVIQSVIIVLLVMFVFLGMRTGVVVASLIPAVIIATLLLMGWFNVGLNQVSLAALIMALGMLVDNAIVMAESMMVRMEKGMKAFESAVESSKELMVPLLISSLTTSAAFLSFYLAESTLGEMMGQLFLVITMALLSSWLMALTLVPLLAVALLKVKKQKQDKQSIFDKLNVYYNKLLNVTLRFSGLTVLSIAALFIVSILSFGKIPFELMPESERNLVTLDLNLPLGTKIEITERNILRIEEFIQNSLLLNEKRQIGVTDWSSYIGEGPNSYDLGYTPGEQNSGYAHMLINTSSGDDNLYVIERLESFCFNNLPNAQVVVKRLGTGGASVPIQIRVTGNSTNEIFKVVNSVKSKLHNIEGTQNIDDDWGPRIKKLFVNIDEVKLRQSGLTNHDIASSLNSSLSGVGVGEFREGDKIIPIHMKSKGSKDISFSELESMVIFSQNSGSNIPLSQVARIYPEWQYAKILRRDLKRTVTIKSQLKQGYNANNVTDELSPWLEEVSSNWPKDMKYEFGGESEMSGKAMGAVSEKLPISLFIIVLLLILQFNSLRKTGIVISTIPLGIIGVVFGLLFMNSNFSFTAFLGIISLAGILINNAIVLIDRIEIERTKMELIEAVKEASNQRFRPILLTTFTTSFGLIPLWISGGPMWKPMAIAIIFGLLFATLITLIFVPILYKLLYSTKK